MEYVTDGKTRSWKTENLKNVDEIFFLKFGILSMLA